MKKEINARKFSLNTLPICIEFGKKLINLVTSRNIEMGSCKLLIIL